MQSPARRAFLRGRRTPDSPWEAFCQRLRLVVEGHFHAFTTPDGHGARLAPRHAADVHHARRLCAEYGILLALDSLSQPPRTGAAPVLWVDPGTDMGLCERLEPGSPAWFVQPGCLLGQLEAAGLPGFADMPCHVSVAAWLADRALCDWPAGQTWRSGISHLSVLLGDGTSAVLGPFGADQQTPLGDATQRQLVSGLFSLAAGAEARACRDAQALWPGRYRLDALAPSDGHGINLAHLLAGHGGALGWLEWVVLDERLLGRQGEGVGDGFSAWRGNGPADLRATAAALDGQAKALFDPGGVYPAPGMFLNPFEG